MLALSGLNCASCAQRVKKALQNISGVKEAAVNFATVKATVRYDPAGYSGYLLDRRTQ
ncbi:MAG TPA: heavy-metal-associated domain-containing protein [Firmicutes bacterium]|nr:heavy-metal-associated domain-containing protein [Bacillota bacterium]